MSPSTRRINGGEASPLGLATPARARLGLQAERCVRVGPVPTPKGLESGHPTLRGYGGRKGRAREADVELALAECFYSGVESHTERGFESVACPFQSAGASRDRFSAARVPP